MIDRTIQNSETEEANLTWQRKVPGYQQETRLFQLDHIMTQVIPDPWTMSYLGCQAN
jgi:hypothetical protein